MLTSLMGSSANGALEGAANLRLMPAMHDQLGKEQSQTVEVKTNSKTNWTTVISDELGMCKPCLCTVGYPEHLCM